MLLTNGKRTWLFDGPAGTTRKEIWRWWEERRFRYNRDLLLVGIVAWLLVLIAGSAAVKDGEDVEEPLVMIFGPIIFALLANIGYTAGPTYDIAYYRGSPRKKLFKAGYIFSLILTASPGGWAVTAWLWTVFTGRKLES